MSLPAFNGRVNMNTAYGWDATQIQDLFANILINFDFYGVEAGARATFADAVGAVNTLVAGNTAFLNPTGLLMVQYQNIAFELETLYDIIGWIFSVTGPSPDTATKQNYYTPLLGLYYVFCQTLINNRDKVPQMVQITFFNQTVAGATIARIVLGANLDRPSRQRKEIARGNRANRMITDGLITLAQRDISLVASMAGAALQRFGHCAETFPFLFAHSLNATVDLESVGGLAAKAYSVFEQPPYQYDEAQFTNSLQLLCDNCRALVHTLHIDPDHFNV